MTTKIGDTEFDVC